MIKNFLMKQMMKRQGVPDAQIDMALEIVNKNPELFKKIGEEIEFKVKKEGKDQMTATMAVMQKYKAELQKLKD